MAYSHPQHGQSADEVQALRRQAGQWLRSLRETKGISQRQLARSVGIEYYTFIAQIEAGRGRIPPERYLAYADAMGVEPRTFVRELLKFYDPVTYAILFGTTDSQRG